MIPIALSVVYYRSKAPGLSFLLISGLFAVAFVACFYAYFKGANELFYQAAFDDDALKGELFTWSKWHWGRVGLEGASLFFLVLGLGRAEQTGIVKNIDNSTGNG